MEHQANLSLLSDRANQTDEIEGSYRFFIGRLHRWQLLDNRLSLSAGGMAVLSLGFIYNTLGGNNPAQARVNLDIMPTGAASYRFQIGKMPFVAHYELQMPLVGLAFSPNYGQSYYEIFLAWRQRPQRGAYHLRLCPHLPSAVLCLHPALPSLGIACGLSRRL